MRNLNNKGFTLMELIATIVILSLVMGITSYSITSIITNSREKEYQLLIKNIRDAAELYYQECKYVDDNCSETVLLGELVSGGYLVTEGDGYEVIDPRNKNDLSGCEIRVYMEDTKLILVDTSETSVCPNSY